MARARKADMGTGTPRTKSMIHDSFLYGPGEHAHYQERGYYIFDRLLTHEALQTCREHLDRIISELPNNLTPEEIMNPHMLGERWFWDLATEPKVLDMVERQIGPNIVLWSAGALAKPPRTGMEVKWHQDAPYWNLSGPFAGGVWIPLDDVDEDNGTMSVLPEWHRKGVLARLVDKQVDFFNEEIDPKALPENIDQLKVPYNLKAGQMATHDTMLPHYSPPNRSSRWRRHLGFRYMSAEGTLADKQYKNYRDGTLYSRQFYLVRGEDVKGYGLKRSP